MSPALHAGFSSPPALNSTPTIFSVLAAFCCPIFPLPNTVSETNSCTLYLCVLPVLLTVCHAAPVVTRCFQTAFSSETENIPRGEKYPKNMVPVTYVTYLPPKDYWQPGSIYVLRSIMEHCISPLLASSKNSNYECCQIVRYLSYPL